MLETYIDLVASAAAAYSRQNAHGMIKTAEDLARYERILAATTPELIIECGTWTGHSALWFGQHGCEVISIDVRAQLSNEVLKESSATFLRGSSTAPDIVRKVQRLASGMRTMVVLDSDHRAEHVAEEIRLYGPLVTPGCYLVVEDGIAEWMEHEVYSGPLHAIDQELSGNPAWRRDTTIEKISPVSMHPAGWWEKL